MMPALARPARRGPAQDRDRLERFHRHQPADAAEQHHVDQRDHGIDLAGRLEQREQPAAGDRADDAADDEHDSHLHIDALAPDRSEEHTYELQSLMRNSYTVL